MKPNIIFIMTDQQRFDTVRAAGYEHMRTPNLDKLMEGGVLFQNAFCPGATCVPSRAAIFTGMYPHNTGVYSFNKWCHHNTWVQDLSENGYYCVNMGKMHCDPLYDPCGFHERRVVENKAAKFMEIHRPSDEWGNFLLNHGMRRPNNRQETYPDWMERYNAIEWEYEERFHPDMFTGNMVCNWLELWDQFKPLFLQIGFPGPHEPYDPPKRYIDLYDEVEIPSPIYKEGELEKKPLQQKTLRDQFKSNSSQESIIDIEKATDEEIKKMRKHYYANVTLIDEQIGHIIGVLEKKGMLENTIVIFTSDHGDNLGDHKLPYKWLMYDAVTRVPLIIKDFRDSRNNKEKKEIHPLVSLIDIGPTILSYAECSLPAYLEGQPLQDYIATGSSDNSYPYVFSEDNYMIMIRSLDYKMVYYIGQSYGELYDLTQDPWELDNLWEEEERKGIKTELKEAIMEWVCKSNYLNGGYKTGKSKQYESRWPDSDKFGFRLL